MQNNRGLGSGLGLKLGSESGLGLGLWRCIRSKEPSTSRTAKAAQGLRLHVTI